MIWLMVPSLRTALATSLYTDDLLMCKIISNPGYYATLRSGMNSVANWINKYYLSLNPIKMQTYDCVKALTTLCKPTYVFNE